MHFGCQNMEKMAKLNSQEVAEQVLQIFTKSLQDHKSLKNILSEFCILEYFGKFFCGQDKVASHLITNLHGSSYELTSLNTNDLSYDWKPAKRTEDKVEEELGVGLISSPMLSFPSLSLSTPVRNFSESRKRSVAESTQQCNSGNKCLKTHVNEQSSSNKKTGFETTKHSLPISPQTLRPLFPENIKYLTAYGTIRYPKRILPTMDPKRIKQRSLIRLRDRFCQLYIGFECDEHVIGVTNCKIWTIKYSVSSRVTPRNLLKCFNEVKMD